MFDIIIIGAGPAGITAGIYAARQRLKTLLITKQFGGQLARKAVDIENYPGFNKISGFQLIEKFEKHLHQQKGIEIEMLEVVKIERKARGQGRDSPRGTVPGFRVLTKGKKQFLAKAIIIASGADPRPVEVPGEKEFLGRGVSYCTVCDGPIFAGKTVAVIGGGNSGFEAAIFLSRLAKKVYILERGQKPAADEHNQELAGKGSNIEIITSARLKEIKGKQFVEEIIYEKISRPSESSCLGNLSSTPHPPSPEVRGDLGGVSSPEGRGDLGGVSPLPLGGGMGGGGYYSSSLPVDAVFVEIGSVPTTSFVKGLVEFNQRDEIKVVPDTGATITPGLFAAGDVTEVKVKQIVVAAGQGAKAALAAGQYLQKK